MAEKNTGLRHPTPAKLFHIVILLSMLALGVSGFYINRPFFEGGMGIMRFTHFISMYVVILAVIGRVYWAFLGSDRDWREFIWHKDDFKKLGPIIKYYLFIKKEHPKTGKYNPLQKATYVLWLLLIIIQAITGFALYWQDASVFVTLNSWVGGAANMRIIHYLIMWIFIVTVAIHVYLGLAEDFKEFLAMFFIKEEESGAE